MSKNRGVLRFRLLPARSPSQHCAEYPSLPFLENKCCHIAFSDLSRNMARVVALLLHDTPIEGLYLALKNVFIVVCVAGPIPRKGTG
jgi:hypothetical protein